MISIILATLLVVVPHPDDEVTLLPQIVAAGENAIVMVMTDGAATGHCPRLGAKKYSEECERMRRESFEGFMAEVAPEATLIWVGLPDGQLRADDVVFWTVNVCENCRILGAGFDYGHSDHNAVRDAMRQLGANVYGNEQYEDPGAWLGAVSRWYGWLDVVGHPHLGIAA